MPGRFLPLILRNLYRSKTRLIATTGCCTIAAAILAFFLAAEHSFSGLLASTANSSNLVLTQKDRY